MKITDVKTYLVRANSGGSANRPRGRNWLFVAVHTDEGIIGYGEGGGWPEVVEAGVREIAPLLIGEDPCAAERIWLKLYDILHGHGLTGAVRGGVQSAIDIALWDIKGKALGVPIHVLLGGAVRDRIRVYGHASTPELARELVAEGYTAFKCQPSAQVLADLRAAVGDEIDIGLHAHGELTVHAAVRLARDAEPYRPAFFEEPTHPDDPDALAAVAARVDVPLAAGERLFHKWAMYDLIKSGAIALVQPETTRLGGITELKKVAGLAEAAGVRVAPHAGSVGPIVEMANVHVMATAPNFLFLEHMPRDIAWRHTVVQGAAKVVDGHIALPTAPGLGIELNLEEMARYGLLPVEDYTYEYRTPEEIRRWRS
ncbi:MAG TPA: mandelate racemase/muconate lactonizing enzyme family protein [Thermomicrobiales bacterium]|nr:mandelate racemase/muconate lactonizing enzyme family protein [Thermomicrobiales bacterium]